MFLFCFLRHYSFRTNVSACLNFLRVEELCGLGLQGIPDQPLASVNVPRYCNPEAKFLFIPGYQIMTGRLHTIFRTVEHF